MSRFALALGLALVGHLAGAAALWRLGTGARATAPRWVTVRAPEKKTSPSGGPGPAIREAATAGLEKTPAAAASPPTTPGGTAPAPLDPNEFQALRERIEAKVRYPFSLRRLGVQGRTVVAVALKADGTAEDMRTSASSGSAELDRLALEAVREAAPFAPLSPPRPVSFLLPIEFRTSDPAHP